MTYRRISVTPVAGALGAEVGGADLRELDEQTFEEIHRAWLEHQVLFFRDQDLLPEHHKAFASRFGPLQIHPYLVSRKDEGHPEVVVFESDESRPYVASGWHTDVTFLEKTPSASVLRGIEVPAFGGDTLFASMYAAYEALSDPMKRVLSDLQAVHDTSRTFSRPAYPSLGKASSEKPPSALHPVVRTHPETGRRGLFVNSAFTHKIKGMHAKESQALLGFLYEHLAQPEFTCRLRWQKNTLAIWDNRCVQHRAVADNLKTLRRMERVTVEGERPA
ncbi:MAG: TauD/TfdA family dioxygenase [Proteobacteria bacterium]|nr:TauD/TfdA family dioxygenase [Pseudomonadota bacterium]